MLARRFCSAVKKSLFPSGYSGLLSNQQKFIIYNDPHVKEFHVVHLSTAEPTTLCRIGWDLGMKSYNGYNNKMSEPEMAFELFMEDILDNRRPKKFSSDDIWDQLMKNKSIINKSPLEHREY